MMQPGIRGTRFRIDILDSSGDRLGDGPLTTVLSLSDTRSLDKIGECSFRLPAGDERTQHIAAGVQFDIYDAVDNYLGRYLYRSKVVSGRASDAIMTVDCWDVLRELTWDTVAFHRTYSTVNIEIIVDALLALGDGWTSDVDAGVGAATIYENFVLLALSCCSVLSARNAVQSAPFLRWAISMWPPLHVYIMPFSSPLPLLYEWFPRRSGSAYVVPTVDVA